MVSAVCKCSCQWTSPIAQKAYSVADVVGNKRFPVYGWESLSSMLGVQVWNKPCFLRLLERNGLEMESGGRGIEMADQVGSSNNL